MRNDGLFGNIGQNCGGGCLGPLANMVSNNDRRDSRGMRPRY